MGEYRVCEKFVSINGEGQKAGQTAVFVRFQGCNLNCSYCDTKWANEKSCTVEVMTVEDILNYILGTGIKNVTLTGGEPLLQRDMKELVNILCGSGLSVEIETNGSVDVSGFLKDDLDVSLTVDYKLPSSGMEKHMLFENYKKLREQDTIKFVCKNSWDLHRALELIKEWEKSGGRGKIYLSPVFGEIDPLDIVNFMIENKLCGVRLQLQLHKIIWDPDKRGV